MKETPRRILWWPLSLSLIGALFCFWITLGNEMIFCGTAGCSLFEDSSVGGISLWYYGLAAFLAMAVVAVSGFGRFGLLFSAVCLAGDIFLLLLMLFTSPCTSCLTVAVLFAFAYYAFRHDARREADKSAFHASGSGRSRLLVCWLLIWGVNLVHVVDAELGEWPIQGEPEQAKVHIYFSPSCSACLKAVKVLAGDISTAFYPVPEKTRDAAVIARTAELREKGVTLYDALTQANKEAPSFSLWQEWSPSVLHLRFRMIRNKAHIFNAGARGVPFFEYLGLPSSVAEKARQIEIRQLKREAEDAMHGTPSKDIKSLLPSNLSVAGSCSEDSPCPE